MITQYFANCQIWETKNIHSELHDLNYSFSFFFQQKVILNISEFMKSLTKVCCHPCSGLRGLFGLCSYYGVTTLCQQENCFFLWVHMNRLLVIS